MAKQTEKILVADGDAEVLDLIAQQVLVPLGYPVATANTGPAALQSALKHQPDIIIAAFDLPGLSGFDLLTALRSQKAHSLVIIIGPRGSEGHMLQAFRLGAKDFLTKPVREAELVTALDRALEELRLRREREQLALKLGSANQQLEKRLKEQTTLYGIGKAVTAITDLNQLFARLLEGALLVTESEVAWLLLADDGQKLILRATKNVPPLAGLKLNQPWDDGLSPLLLLSGEGIHIAGEPLAKMAAGQIAKAAVAVPIKAKERVMGVLVAGNKTGRPFSERDQGMLSAVADYASIALVNARLFQELESRARALQKSYDDLARGAGLSPEANTRLKELNAWLTQLGVSLDAVLRGEIGPLSAKQAEALRLIADRLEAARRTAEGLSGQSQPR